MLSLPGENGAFIKNHCVQSLFSSKTIWSKTKYVIKDLLEYFGWEAKKSGCRVKCAHKISKATDKLYFSSSWNILTILLQ